MGAGLCSVFDLDEKLVEAEKLTQKPQQSMDRKEDVTQDQEEELKRQQEEEEKRKAEEVARIEEERQRQRELAERQKEEELRVQHEQEKRLVEEQRRREEKRRIEVEARRAEEERLREKKKADGVSLENFLSECGGLTDVNEKKKGNFGKYSYPLHTAVKQCNAEIVRILLENKADKTLTSSSGQTALDKAKKYNENDSHSEVIHLLSQ